MLKLTNNITAFKLEENQKLKFTICFFVFNTRKPRIKIAFFEVSWLQLILPPCKQNLEGSKANLCDQIK